MFAPAARDPRRRRCVRRRTRPRPGCGSGSSRAYDMGLGMGLTERDSAVIQDELGDRGAAVGDRDLRDDLQPPARQRRRGPPRGEAAHHDPRGPRPGSGPSAHGHAQQGAHPSATHAPGAGATRA
ncbi:hypothetical protein DXZ75_19830 [Streptomyces sp. AcE210]|nr:hypothetical protein DXZ75_19830 [Streptomyces sp. AcE210]